MIRKSDKGYMLSKIKPYAKKPRLFEESTTIFWNDAYISKSILQTHLDKEFDLATRKYDFVQSTVAWISQQAPLPAVKDLLDLGCGPGIYAELFNEKGYTVTGIDFSERSINHAKDKSKANGTQITYHYQNYLEINYAACFDLVTMIYCDFGVLSKNNRTTMLEKTYAALRKGGKFIFDVFTPNQHKAQQESTNWEFNNHFWTPEQSLCLNSFYRYDEDNTVLNQTIVITDEETQCYNIWEHCFEKEELIKDLENAGFINIKIYNNLLGETYHKDSNTLGIIATK